jgi:hypothetical protein
MNCELCSSGQREGARRLCLACMEAIARLLEIVNSVAEGAAGAALTVQAAVQPERAPIISRDTQLKRLMRLS